MKKLILIATCFTLVDLKNVECRSYCKFYAGYDTGVYVEKTNKCFCQDEVESERLNEKRLFVPSKIVKTDAYEYNPADIPKEEEPQEVTIPYKLPWE